MPSYAKVGLGFNVTTFSPVDRRFILSKAEMLTERFEDDQKIIPIPYRNKDAKTNQMYIALCSENNKLYIYSRELPVSEETGRFHPIDEFLQFDITDNAKKVYFENLQKCLTGSYQIAPADAPAIPLDRVVLDGGDVTDDLGLQDIPNVSDLPTP